MVSSGLRVVHRQGHIFGAWKSERLVIIFGFYYTSPGMDGCAKLNRNGCFFSETWKICWF